MFNFLVKSLNVWLKFKHCDSEVLYAPLGYELAKLDYTPSYCTHMFCLVKVP